MAPSWEGEAPTEPRVFTDDLVTRLGRHWANRPEYQWPDLYKVAVLERCRSIRDEIEWCVGRLGEDDQNKIILRLQDPKNYPPTRNELLVWRLLREGRFCPRYEEWGKRSPDWITYKTRPRRLIAAVEVVSPQTSDERRGHDRQIYELTQRLEKIPLGVVLGVDLNPEKCALDSARSRALAEYVACWLDHDPRVGEEFNLWGVEITLSQRRDDLRSVYCVHGVSWHRVSSAQLTRKIEAKVSKHGKTCLSRHTPLVIAIVPHPDTGLDFDSCEDVCLGTDAGQMRMTPDASHIELKWVWLSDGLFRRHQTLCGVVWVDEFGGRWKGQILENPDATLRVPSEISDLFPRIETAT
jgi:hypothetical protein